MCLIFDPTFFDSVRALNDAEEAFEGLNSYVTNLILQREANLQDVDAYEQLLAQGEESLTNVVNSIADAKREVEEERELRIWREEQQNVLSEVLELPNRQETTSHLEELEAEIAKLQEEDDNARRQETLKRKNLAVLAELCDAFMRSATSAEQEMFDAKSLDEPLDEIEDQYQVPEDEDEDDLTAELLDNDDEELTHEDDSKEDSEKMEDK